MNGWKRLWVVLSILIGFAFIAAGKEYVPTRQGLISGYESSHPWAQYQAVDPIVRAQQVADDKEFQAGLDSLIWAQLLSIATTFAWWVFTSVSLYVSGWAIGWIYRGFRPKKESAS